MTDEPYLARAHRREVTYQQDITDWAQVTAQIRQLAQRVADDLAGQQRPAVRVVVKVRYPPFFTVTRGVPLAEPTWTGAIEAGAAAAWPVHPAARSACSASAPSSPTPESSARESPGPRWPGAPLRDDRTLP